MRDGTFNDYFYLSLGIPALIMLAAGLLRNKNWVPMLAVISLVATYQLCNLAVHKKWEIRAATAVTEVDQERATHDGANLVFTGIVLAPLQAIVSTAVWGVVGACLGTYIRSTSRSRVP